jgi:N-acetylglucosamine-6-phosphate deacetylase
VRYHLKNLDIYDGDKFLIAHDILFEGNKILDVAKKIESFADINIDCKKAILTPGLIDIQVNGAFGKLVEEFSNQDLYEFDNQLKSAGVLSWIPTILNPNIERLNYIVDFINKNHNFTGIEGLHIEGAWFSEINKGCHPVTSPLLIEDFIKAIDRLSKPLNIVITQDYTKINDAVVRQLCSRDKTTLMLGHSNATYDEASKLFDMGVSGITDLSNGTSSFTSKEPGIIGAFSDHNKNWATVIPDGKHIHKATMKLLKVISGRNKLCAISNLMPGFGLNINSKFDFLGVEVLVTKSGTIDCNDNVFGSTILLNECLRYLVTECSIPFDEALMMGSLWPRNLLKQNTNQYKVSPGNKADFILHDTSFNIKGHCIKGNFKFFN